MTRNLDAKDEVHTHFVCTSVGWRSFAIISEAGLYSAILKSKRPEAKEFKR